MMAWTDVTPAAIGGAMLGAFGREMTRILASRFRSKNGSNGGKVGEQPAALWREATKEDTRAAVTDALGQHTEILRSLAASNEKIRDGVSELVTLQRNRGRR